MSTPISYTYVEDYIEVMAGIYDIHRKNRCYFAPSPIITLARYDVAVLTSIAESCVDGRALTTKQADLCLRLINNYRKQLTKHGIDITPTENPKYRQPLRLVSQARSVEVNDDVIVVKFPYNENMITEVRTLAKESQGHCNWNPDARVWELGLTEYNVSWVYAWARNNNFALSERFEELFGLVNALEQQDYSIVLTLEGDTPCIKNAHSSLINYINDNSLGFTLDNLEWLVDNSAILGYTVDPAINQALEIRYDSIMVQMYNARTMRINTAKCNVVDALVKIVEYSKQTKRGPVLVHETVRTAGLGRVVKVLMQNRNLGVSCRISNSPITQEEYEAICQNTDLIYTSNNAVVRDLPRIPLLVTDMGIVHGSIRHTTMSRAEKTIYLATFVQQGGAEVDGITELKYDQTMSNSNQG
jgi:hypothetical protein